MVDINQLALWLGVSIPAAIEVIVATGLYIYMSVRKKQEKEELKRIYDSSLEEVKKVASKIISVAKDISEVKTQISQINIELKDKRNK